MKRIIILLGFFCLAVLVLHVQLHASKSYLIDRAYFVKKAKTIFNTAAQKQDTNHINASNSQPSPIYKNFTPGALWYDSGNKIINAHGGGLLFHGGKYYWFGEHKVEGAIGNSAQVGVHCYSSSDLYNWKDEGIALSVSESPLNDLAKGCILERPKVVYNRHTKSFVMWFHLELAGKGYSAARAGVATSKKITGPYTFIRSYRPNAKALPYYPADIPDSEKINCSKPSNKGDIFFCRDFDGGQMARDMTVFVDDDGKAYHVFSSEENFTLQLAELTDDYTGNTGKFIRIYIGHQTEAPALFKYKHKYYLIGSGCTGWAPNAARWFVADSIWGKWEYKGNPCQGEGSDKTFGGQSTYILPVNGKKDAFIFMADKWNPMNPIDGRYIWLPINFNESGIPLIKWINSWNLDTFKN